MELCIRVKGSSINNLSDGRYFAPFAEWIGFNFNPQNRNGIDLSKAVMIMSWLSGPRIVGEFDDLPLATVNSIVKELQLDTIQTDIDLLSNDLSPIISTVIRRIVILPNMSEVDVLGVVQNTRGVSYFLLDFQTHGVLWENLGYNGLFSLSFLAELCNKYPIILGAVFTPQNILSIVNSVNVLGISLLGGNELQTGIRLFDDVQDIVEQLEIF